MPPTKTWKSIEAKVAAYFGLVRRGADYGDRNGGKNDAKNPDGTESETWSLEIKHGKRITYQLALDAIRQAERACTGTQEPVAVLHREGEKIADSLVVQRLATFCDYRLGGLPEEGPK